jgi:hypothetical protein
MVRPSVAAIPSTVAERFGIFRSSPEAIPRRLRRQVHSLLPTLNPELAQRLPVASPPLWAAVGNDAVCLVSAHRRDLTGVCTRM